MPRKQLSATVSSSGGSITQNNSMVLNTQMEASIGTTPATTKYITANGYLNDSSGILGYDPSDPTNNAVQEAYVCPVAAVISNARYYGYIPAVAQTFTCTLMKNGVATAITFVVTSATNDGNGNGLIADNTHTVSVVANDLLSWKIVTSAGALNAGGGFSALYTPV